MAASNDAAAAVQGGHPTMSSVSGLTQTQPFLFDHVHCCVCYLDYHPTAARQAQTATGLRSASTSLPFYVTECAHILCRNDFQHAAQGHADATSLATCPVCRATGVNVTPLDEDNFQHAHMSRLIDFLKAQSLKQKQVLQRASHELTAAKELRAELEGVKRENALLKERLKEAEDGRGRPPTFRFQLGQRQEGDYAFQSASVASVDRPYSRSVVGTAAGSSGQATGTLRRPAPQKETGSHRSGGPPRSYGTSSSAVRAMPTMPAPVLPSSSSRSHRDVDAVSVRSDTTALRPHASSHRQAFRPSTLSREPVPGAAGPATSAATQEFRPFSARDPAQVRGYRRSDL
ncbi:uncharacterized protein PFL1_01946 [Pseudozyma flocculosa PF-1]|uniref:uncharacterized protein n=1 Tax=Pseudozyma flocculosa PF-1 TaxID=1277687 RepID=UPI000456121F|nr:uncharacterized protein PFL1_01946 [Pseudozyma flocculosa PF-1]EPQ30420.1 hypothetical protein PFL1_01946 [Pseudozyma flocculosa PF-1]